MFEDDVGIYKSYVSKKYVKDVLFPRYISYILQVDKIKVQLRVIWEVVSVAWLLLELYIYCYLIMMESFVVYSI